MNNIQIKRLLWILFLCCILFISCKEEDNENEPLNDLFPLNIGNEFYFDYSMTRYEAFTVYTKGVIEWKVINSFADETNINYTIQRKLNAIVTIPTIGDTTVITDQIHNFIVTQNKISSLISFWGFEFYRFQVDSQIELNQDGGTSMPSHSCVFKADSGMVYYSYYHPPNQVVYEYMFLDSLKIIP